MATPLLQRKRDLLYLTYFTIAIPIAFIIDLQPLYPVHLIPNFMTGLTDYYVSNWHDQNFVDPTPSFVAFIWSEALVQVPVMIWGWGALYNNNPKLPLVLLPFSCLIFITTGSLMVEQLYWPIPLEQKFGLMTLYGPYLALSAFMFLDMYSRLSGIVEKFALERTSGPQKKVL